jgi:hypothetical protein
VFDVMNVMFTYAHVCICRHDALIEHSVRVHGHISKLRIPFLITVISLYAIQLATIILAMLLFAAYTYIVHIVNAAVLAFFAVSCSIYYTVIAVKVIQRLKASPLREKRPIGKVQNQIRYSFIHFSIFSVLLKEFVPNLSTLFSLSFLCCSSYHKKLTGLVIASAIGLFLFAALIIIGLTPVQEYPSGYVFWFSMLFISLNYIALTHVLSFQPLRGSPNKALSSTEDESATKTSMTENVTSDKPQSTATS